MAASKSQLELVLQAINKASGPIAEVKAAIAGLAPQAQKTSGVLAKLGDLGGISRIGDAAKGAYSHVAALASKVVGLGGDLYGLVKATAAEGGALAKASDSAGLAVDRFAALRYASGLTHDDFTQGITTFAKNLALAKTGFGKGPLQSLLEDASPAFLAQLKRTKTTQQALDLVIRAYERLNVGQKQAFGAAAFGGAGPKFVPFLSKGELAITDLQNAYGRLAGPQEDFARKSGAVTRALKDQEIAVDAAKKAALVQLYPAITEVAGALTTYVVNNRPYIELWARQFGKDLPSSIDLLLSKTSELYTDARRFVDKVGGMKNILIGLGLVAAGPTLLAFTQLGLAIGGTAVSGGIALATLGARGTAAMASLAFATSGATGAAGALRVALLALPALALAGLAAYTIKEQIDANKSLTRWKAADPKTRGEFRLNRPFQDAADPRDDFSSMGGRPSSLARFESRPGRGPRPVAAALGEPGAAGAAQPSPGRGGAVEVLTDMLERIRAASRAELGRGPAAAASLGPPRLGPTQDPKAPAVAALQRPQKGKLEIKVAFDEIPPGTKVTSSASGLDDTDVEIERGYSGAFVQ